MIIEINTTAALIIAIAMLINILASLWGILDLYAMMRFRKNHKIDKTAIMDNWINLKWMFASRAEEMAKKHPWLSQDLSEALGEKPNDDKIS